MAHRGRSGAADAILLLEIALALLLLGLFLALYWVPSSEPGFVPPLWVWPLLVVLFFGILLLEYRRRRRTVRTRMEEALRDASAPDEDGPAPR